MVNFSLRLDEELHRRLKDLAEKEHRSIHAQIIYMLEKSLDELDKEKRQS